MLLPVMLPKLLLKWMINWAEDEFGGWQWLSLMTSGSNLGNWAPGILVCNSCVEAQQSKDNYDVIFQPPSPFLILRD